ncbi:PTS sugar transporter subunit IIA [candidate division TA06 bacterium]|nr:PTS sugar transporter subunit IIA [candidate division TA06 bacterium]
MKLKELLKPELIELELKNNNKKGVLQELVGLFPLDEKAKGILLETLKKREELGSTGVGKGIAIPHCRSLLVKDLHLVIGRSKKGVDFGALDGKQVHLFFLIVASPLEPTNQYLIVLGKVAQIAREITKDQRILEIDEKSEFIRFLGEVEESLQG